jgi:hypothetical protein
MRAKVLRRQFSKAAAFLLRKRGMSRYAGD